MRFGLSTSSTARLLTAARCGWRNVVDEFTRQALVMHIARSVSADDLVGPLDRLVGEHGARAFVRCDNGPELTCPGSVEAVRWRSVGSGRNGSRMARDRGRQPSINRSFEIEATRETREWLGEPSDHAHRGSLLDVREIPDGEDGIIAARLSRQDVKNHETLAATGLRTSLVARKPRWLTPTVNGAAPTC